MVTPLKEQQGIRIATIKMAIDKALSNNNPPPTNPTGQYSSTGCQFNLNIPENGAQASGTLMANVNCVIQLNGDSILLALAPTPTSIPESLNQAIKNSPVTFNFAGTASGSQINANSAGSVGPNNSPAAFDFNLSGSLASNELALTITSASDSDFSRTNSRQFSNQVDSLMKKKRTHTREFNLNRVLTEILNNLAE